MKKKMRDSMKQIPSLNAMLAIRGDEFSIARAMGNESSDKMKSYSF